MQLAKKATPSALYQQKGRFYIMTIGERITKCRKERNLSQEYIADSLGISRQAVSKWEQDLSSPDTHNLIALCRLLGVSVEYLVSGQRSEGLSYRPFPTFKIIGIILITVGLLALVIGLLTLWLISVLAVLITLFGILLVALERQGALLSFAILLTFFALTFAVGFTSGLDNNSVTIIFAASALLPLAAFAVIKAIQRARTK